MNRVGVILATFCFVAASSVIARSIEPIKNPKVLNGEKLKDVYKAGVANLRGNHLGEAEIVLRRSVKRVRFESWNALIHRALKDEGIQGIKITHVNKDSNLFPTLLEIAVKNLDYLRRGTRESKKRLKNIYQTLYGALKVRPLSLVSLDSKHLIGAKEANGLAVIDHQYNEIVILITGAK